MQGRSNRLVRGRWLIVAVLALSVTLVGVLLEWEDAVIVALVIVAVQGLPRKGLSVASVLLLTAAFPPWGWPTWWCCFTPLVGVWRGTEGRSRGRDLAEAVAIGFAMCWLTTGFVRDAVATRGVLLQGSGCLLFGLETMLFPIALRRLGGRSVIVTAVVMTAVAALGEWLQASFMNGVAWTMMALYLPVADTPLAQWAAIVTPLGVSMLLYTVNFLWLPILSRRGWQRWGGSLLAAALLSLAWFGSEQIARAVAVKPLAFSALLVQPHLRGNEGPWRPWITLDYLTRESLSEHGPVDLVVWPETSLSDSWHPTSSEAATEPAPADETAERQMTLQGFESMYRPEYASACLVGVPLVKRVMVQRYGLQIPEGRRVNCACLIDRCGEVACHEKLSLVPIREGLPKLIDTPWVRRTLLPYYRLEARVKAGKVSQLLSFSTRVGRTMTIAASICYESHLPWLPQFDPSNRADAIVHITYDGDFSGHPGWAERQLAACRYRAIESRTWNLVCSTWSGSAIIDPVGRIVARLPAEAGVLRSDDMRSETR